MACSCGYDAPDLGQHMFIEQHFPTCSCGEAVASFADLQRHQSSTGHDGNHSNHRLPWLCRCGMLFPDIEQMSAHHARTNHVLYFCPDGTTALRNETADLHVPEHTSGAGNCFCGFQDDGDLGVHMHVSGHIPNCFCGAELQTFAALAQHQKSTGHIGVALSRRDALLCRCGHVFYEREELRAHRTQTGCKENFLSHPSFRTDCDAEEEKIPRPVLARLARGIPDWGLHYCIKCDALVWHVKKHLRKALAHGDEGKIECPICLVRFKSAHDLEEHSREYHAAGLVPLVPLDEPYGCALTGCSREFSGPESILDLIQHILTCEHLEFLDEDTRYALHQQYSMNACLQERSLPWADVLDLVPNYRRYFGAYSRDELFRADSALREHDDGSATVNNYGMVLGGTGEHHGIFLSGRDSAGPEDDEDDDL